MDIKLPKTRKAQEKFDRIISAADNEFYNKGYEKATIASIAAAADIAVGTLYLYFKDKLSLYHYILFDYQERIVRYINFRIGNVKSRQEKERLGLIAWLEFINENPHTYMIIMQSLTIDKHLLTDYYMKFSQRYAKGLEIDKEQIIDIDYEYLSLALMGIVSFIGFKQLFLERKLIDEEINHVADSIMQFLSKGLFR